MLIEIPADQLVGPAARVKYLKKIPIISRESLIFACKSVWQQDPIASALASYLFLIGGRISEATRYSYNGIYKKDLKMKSKFDSPKVNTLKFSTTPSGVHLLTMKVRREKMGKLTKKDFANRFIDYPGFLKRKQEILGNSFHHDVIIVAGERDYEALDSPFVEILYDYLGYLRMRYKIETPVDELKFQNLELFPFSSTRGQLLITKYFGVNSHYFRKQSATLFAREQGANLFELKARYNWKSNDIPSRYVQEDATAVMIRQLNFLHSSTEYEIATPQDYEESFKKKFGIKERQEDKIDDLLDESDNN